MKRLVIALTAAALLLSSCKYSNSSRSSAIHSAPFETSLLEVESLEDPNVTLDLYWPFERNIAAGDIYMQEAIDAFEAKYGGKVTVNEIGFNTGIEVMQRNLAGGDVSDLMFVEISIHGRHDPVIVPRAVVVVECMTALTVLDSLLASMTSQMDRIKAFFQQL